VCHPMLESHTIPPCNCYLSANEAGPGDPDHVAGPCPDKQVGRDKPVHNDPTLGAIRDSALRHP
jgi:hypothetical protein